MRPFSASATIKSIALVTEFGTRATAKKLPCAARVGVQDHGPGDQRAGVGGRVRCHGDVVERIAVAVHGGKAKLFHRHGLRVEGREREQCGGAEGKLSDCLTALTGKRAEIISSRNGNPSASPYYFCSAGCRLARHPARSAVYAITMIVTGVAPQLHYVTALLDSVSPRRQLASFRAGAGCRSNAVARVR